METIADVYALALALIGACVGGATVAAGFIAYIQRKDARLRAVEKQCILALSRTGNIMKKLGLAERYTDELLRLMLTANATPQFTKALDDGSDNDPD